MALVTGAARGIGLAIAQRLAQDGVAVAVADLDLEEAQAAAAAISASGGRSIGVSGDVALPSDCQAMARGAADGLGGLHILVNNAGITRDAMVHKMTDDQWRLVQDVVLGGAFNMVRAVAPWFRDHERTAPRRIVNIASVSGIYGSPGNVNYSSAKAGLIGLTRTIAEEWARFGVTVNAVAPGFIATRMTAARDAGQELGMDATIRDAIIARIPAGRAGEPADVAEAVAFFASPAAGFITGQVLEVHGGLPDISVTR